MTRSTPSTRLTSTVFTPTSSLTRRPLAYISSSIVRSRKPSADSTSQAAEKRFDLRLRQRLRHAQRLARRSEAQRRIGRDQPLAQGPAKEALEDAQAAVRARRRAAGVAGDGVFAQVGFACIEQRLAGAPLEPGGEQRQVAAIGGQRVGGEAVLDPQRLDEAIDRLGIRGGRRVHSSVSFCVTTTFL